VRISHKELEECLRDPPSWVASKFNDSAGGPRGGYDYCLREGIYYFHKTDDPAGTRNYLERTLSKRKLANRLRVEGVLERFDAYVYWFRKSGVLVADHRCQLEFDLGSGLILGGVISRLDITSGGYRSILLGAIPLTWRGEARMPLIQRGMAKKYGRPEDEFAIGYQELDASDLQTGSYSREELDEAEENARRLAEGINREITKYRPTADTTALM
jgi:hypothetical protein